MKERMKRDEERRTARKENGLQKKITYGIFHFMGHLSLVPSTSRPLIPNSAFKEVTDKITTRGQVCGGKRRNAAAIFYTSPSSR
jgi:hypothetical protein